MVDRLIHQLIDKILQKTAETRVLYDAVIEEWFI